MTFKPKKDEKLIVEIWTDGGCRSTAKKGETIKPTDRCAYAYFMKFGGQEKLGGAAGHGYTNNQMEIYAVLKALKSMKKYDVPVKVYSDSAYVVNCINQKWYVKWEKNGWTKKGGLANANLWKSLVDEIRKFPFFSIEKVKGHSGLNDGNDIVDKHLNKLMDELG